MLNNVFGHKNAQITAAHIIRKIFFYTYSLDTKLQYFTFLSMFKTEKFKSLSA